MREPGALNRYRTPNLISFHLKAAFGRLFFSRQPVGLKTAVRLLTDLPLGRAKMSAHQYANSGALTRDRCPYSNYEVEDHG